MHSGPPGRLFRTREGGRMLLDWTSDKKKIPRILSPEFSSLTFREPWLYSLQEIQRCRVFNRFELVIVGDVDMRPEIVSRESQPDNQPLVTKNALLIAENRVSKLRVETR